MTKLINLIKSIQHTLISREMLKSLSKHIQSYPLSQCTAQ